ncbi:putative GIY-YIG endonuclease [Plasmopara halstedii]
MIGRVYKIVHSQSDICYVGSTINELRVRWKNHKASNNTCAIADHIKEHEADQFK